MQSWAQDRTRNSISVSHQCSLLKTTCTVNYGLDSVDHKSTYKREIANTFLYCAVSFGYPLKEFSNSVFNIEKKSKDLNVSKFPFNYIFRCTLRWPGYCVITEKSFFWEKKINSAINHICSEQIKFKLNKSIYLQTGMQYNLVPVLLTWAHLLLPGM